MARARTSPQPEVPGLAARRIAADILDGVLRRRSPLDEQLSGKTAHPGLPALADRDRALMRRLVATVLRRLGTLRHLLGGFLDKGFPADAPRAETILLIGAAQILWLEVPDHAAVDLSVRLAQADRRAARYAGLVNAVLRRVTQNRAAHRPRRIRRATRPTGCSSAGPRITAPRPRAPSPIANGHEPALDLTVKGRRRKLGRAAARPRAADRHGAHAGAGRDHAAARFQRRRLVGAGRRRRAAGASARRRRAALRVADLCAAPGGKTAQLALAGARVTAVDRSPARLARLRENLARLALEAETVAADVLEWQSRTVRRRAARCALLVDRHHPPPSRRALAQERSRHRACWSRCSSELLDRAADLLKPGGTLVYCVCSLEPEEGERQIAALLAREPRLARRPSPPDEVFGRGEFITADGDLRTLPFHLPDADPRWGGLDGFYAARLAAKSRLIDGRRGHIGRPAPLRYRCEPRGESGAPQGTSTFMMRVSVAERARLSVLIGRRAFRSLLGQINAHPLLRWRFGSAKTDRLVIAPQDLRTADATRASEIYAGRFAFAGKVVICDRRSPFEMTPPSDEWAVTLLSFSWLRHLRAADSRDHPRQCPLADRRVDQPARRLAPARLALRHPLAPHLVLAQPGAVRAAGRRRALLPPLHPQPVAAGALSAPRARSNRATALPRLQAVIALTYAALCIQGQSGHLRGSARRLIEELRRQILPDGGHISRNPGALIELLADLLPLRQLFAARQSAAAAGAQQRHRPHDADAALLPAWRRQFRAVQRHGADAGRPARHRARL